jgi:hypothetical protein
MPRPRRSKSLEKVARSIKDDDAFVEHVLSITARYRAQYELETGAKGREVRQAVKVFTRHAQALALWLQRAQRETTAEHEALGLLSTVLHGSPVATRPQAIASALWLSGTAAASDRALAMLKRGPLQHAPRTTAEALRATFEHHGLKLSYGARPNDPSPAVRLFCAIAKAAGDVGMTPAVAAQWLKSGRGAAAKKST